MSIIIYLNLITIIFFKYNAYSMNSKKITHSFAYCVNKNNKSDWYWIRGDEQSYHYVLGYLLTKNKKVIFSQFKINLQNKKSFIVSKKDFNELLNLCPETHYVQPAINKFDDWYQFAMIDNNNPKKPILIYANGHNR